MIGTARSVQGLDHLRTFQAYHDHFGLLENAVQVSADKRVDVRDVLLDETAISPEKARQVDLRVEHAQLQPLADEVLGEGDQRTFAQVVCAALERQADHADPAHPCRKYFG